MLSRNLPWTKEDDERLESSLCRGRQLSPLPPHSAARRSRSAFAPVMSAAHSRPCGPSGRLIKFAADCPCRRFQQKLPVSWSRSPNSIRGGAAIRLQRPPSAKSPARQLPDGASHEGECNGDAPRWYQIRNRRPLQAIRRSSLSAPQRHSACYRLGSRSSTRRPQAQRRGLANTKPIMKAIPSAANGDGGIGRRRQPRADDGRSQLAFCRFPRLHPKVSGTALKARSLSGCHTA